MGDRELKQDILEELDFEPSIHATDLGIAVDGGVVTITGHVANLPAKTTVLDIVEGIRGVRAIADEIEVRSPGAHITADDEIAKRVVTTLKWNTSVPEGNIHAVVNRGWVTLRGQVEWRCQSHAAELAVRRLIGVTGVINLLKVVPAASAQDVSDRIQKALRRNAEIDASDILIALDGSVVTLEGKVRHLAERRNAERAAWAAPGVTEVINRLYVV